MRAGGIHQPLIGCSTHTHNGNFFFETLSISILLQLQLLHTKTITKQICQGELLHFGLVCERLTRTHLNKIKGTTY